MEQHVRRLVESGNYLDDAERAQLNEMRSALAGQELPVPVPRFAYQPVVHQEEKAAPDASDTTDVQEAEDPLDDIVPAAIREELARNGIVNGEVVDPEALSRNPFIQQVETDAAVIAAEESSADEQEPQAEPDIPPLRPGERRIPEHDGIPAMREVTIDLTLDEPLPLPRHPQRPPQEPPFVYDLHPGDTIYMDGRPFNVDEVRFFAVTFRDPEMVYPIFRAEIKSILGPLLDRDERNLPFRTAPLEQAQTEEGQETELPPVQETASEPAVNFRITDDHLGEGGQKTKFENNMRAIRTLKTLEKENRPASPEDQEVLSQYVGWGGIPQAFDERNAAWADEYRELKFTLTPEEYEMARASTLNAHYTSPTVIRAIYSAVKQMGFRTGNILEPSCGVGNFFGLLPETMQNSRLYGVELDSITGRIAQYLYPQADIAVTGFEKTDRKDFFDLAIGNVPFGAYKVADRQFDRYNFLIHDYFFAKALDQVRPGGIVAFITSKVNACVNNIFRIWQEGANGRLTQLVFCDISTPKGMERTSPQTDTAEKTDSPRDEDELPPLEPVDDLTELAGSSSEAVVSDFNVYEDIRSKLIARGVPPEEIAFIHDADTEVKKKVLFAKVRAGQVRVLIGSTAKMGAGTNCQDRLIALHDLDCPWRPGDLEQRSGRIVRQGNMNPDVQIYRYATEGTFDSYLWQTVENNPESHQV